MRLGLHLLDVGAGREGFFVAGDDHAGDCSVRLERVERGGQLLVHLGIERIERGRPVEADDADLAFGFDDDGFIAHDAFAPRGKVIGSIA